MTPEEELQMQAAIMRSLQMPQNPGMINQSQITPEMAQQAAYDGSGEATRLAAQQQFLREMGQTAAPQGIQAGDLYVAGASPLTALAQAVRSGASAYGQYKTGQQQQDVAQQQQQAAQAGAENARIIDARDAQLAQQAAELTRNKFGYQQSQDAISNQRAQQAATTAAAARDRGMAIDPNEPEKGNRATLTAADGTRTFEDGTLVPENWVDWNTWADNERMERASAAGGNDKAVTRQSEKLNMSLQRYGAALEKSHIPRVKSDIKTVETLLAKLPRDDKGDIIEVPGIGTGQNIQGIGDVLTLGESVLAGDDAYGGVAPAQMRNAIQRVLNTEIRAQSGAAVTLHEMVRNKMGAGVDWISNDKDFLEFGWPAIQEALSAIEGNYNAAYGPEVAEIYNRRLAGENLTTREYLETKLGAANLENLSLEELRKLAEEDE